MPYIKGTHFWTLETSRNYPKNGTFRKRQYIGVQIRNERKQKMDTWLFHWTNKRGKRMGIEELKNYQDKLRRAERTNEEYEKFKTRAEKMTATFSLTTGKTNFVGDKVGDNAVIMADISTEYKTRWLEAEQDVIKILKKIDTLPETYGEILAMHFVDNMTLNEIAGIKHYSISQIKRKYKTALELYDKK